MANVTGTTYFGSADIGYNSEFLVGQGGASPETFVAVADVIRINMGGFTAPTYDKTHLRSPGRAREKGVTISDYEDIEVVCNYNPTHGSHNVAGGDGFSATHNLNALNKSLIEVNFLVLFGTESPQEETAIRGVVSGRSLGEITVDGKREVTYTITPLSDYRL
jgi:hypothetical protein